MTCQQSELVTDYLNNRLSDEASEVFEQHIEECDVCVAALSAKEKSAGMPAWLLTAQRRFDEGRLRNLMFPRGDGLPSGTYDDEESPSNDPALAISEVPARGMNGVRYSWKRRIGSGGMGEVWEGWDQLMRRPVALKRLNQQSRDIDGVQRLLQEATTLSRLSCPHIVTVYGVIADHARPVLVMEFIPGMTLSQWQDGRPLRQQDAAEVLLILAQALHHAHYQGVIHRDLKPSNILLRTESTTELPRDEQGVLRIWLSDFGLARVTDDPSLTLSGQLLGTPVYMAPEQLSGGQAADVRTDVYGLGAILYELLTGIPPFMGNDSVVLMQLIRSHDPVSPRRLQPQLSRDIETICLKCLARRPSDRYATVAALTADLEAFLAGLPISARPISLPTRLLRWSARNRALATTLGITAAALVIALLLGLYAVREQSTTLAVQRRAADDERRLRLRAEAAEKEAESRAAAESQLRSKHETLLLQMVRTVDKHQQSANVNSGLPDVVPGSMTTETSFVTTQVLNEYVQSLKQLKQPLSWSELELMIRFLSLKLAAEDTSGLDTLVSRIDEALAVHGATPENPQDYVLFIKIRQLLFGAGVDASQLHEDNRKKWLQVAARFLDTARRSESPVTDNFLNARCEALRQAFDAGRSSDQYSSQDGRHQMTDHLRSLTEVLKEPIPDTGQSRSAERELLMQIQRALDSAGV